MYEVNGFIKYAEMDDYNEGCDPDTGRSYSMDIHFSSDSLPTLIEKLKDFVGTDPCVELNACDEDGRVDIFLMEDGDGNQATKSQLEEWRKGQCILWSATYTFDVVEVERKTVRIPEFQ